jgi:hypothetical protein
MKTNTDNALAIKRELRPEDYRRDQSLVIVNPKTGVKHTFPTSLVVALRSGLVKFE